MLNPQHNDVTYIHGEWSRLDEGQLRRYKMHQHFNSQQLASVTSVLTAIAGASFSLIIGCSASGNSAHWMPCQPAGHIPVKACAYRTGRSWHERMTVSDKLTLWCLNHLNAQANKYPHSSHFRDLNELQGGPSAQVLPVIHRVSMQKAQHRHEVVAHNNLAACKCLGEPHWQLQGAATPVQA